MFCFKRDFDVWTFFVLRAAENKTIFYSKNLDYLKSYLVVNLADDEFTVHYASAGE